MYYAGLAVIIVLILVYLMNGRGNSTDNFSWGIWYIKEAFDDIEFSPIPPRFHRIVKLMVYLLLAFILLIAFAFLLHVGLGILEKL